MAVKVPPHNQEAEQSILGGLMLDVEAWDQVADLLRAEDFYRPAHQVIYAAISEIASKNMPVDIITVSNTLTNNGQIELAGGSEYLIDLLNRTVSAANITHHAKIVRDKSLLRKVINTSSKMIERAYEQDFDEVDTFIDEVEGAIFQLGENKQQSGLTNAMEIVKTSLEKIEELYDRKQLITGLSTGFNGLDAMTAGLHPGELTIIAARPSMGKTAFSLNMVQHIALKQKKTLAYFSVEMGKEAVMMRLLASEAKINISDIRNGQIQDSAWPRLISAAGALSEAHLYIDDTSGISPHEIRARARRLKAQHGIDLIMIDYLQLMDLKLKVESRERAVSEISKLLKSIAKELQIPVIALAQLNRAVESRGDRRPMLSDLRESGSIEQDADVIMMLYRDDYYEKDDPEKAGHAEIIIAKQRNGPTGAVKLRWEAKIGKFRDPDPEASHPMPRPPAPPMMPGKPKNFAPGSNN